MCQIMTKKLEWTEGRRRSFITSVLRAGSRKWPPKYKTLEQACVGTRTNEKTGRLAKHYKCAKCLDSFPAKEIDIDHIDPIVPVETGFTTWDDFIKRLFCPVEQLQALCRVCHKEKSASERIRRNK